MDDWIITLYTAKLAVLTVFAAACVWRAIENNLHHHRMKWALLWLAGFLGFLAASMGYRLWAAQHPAAIGRVLLRTWHFGFVELGATVCAVGLFFVLQKPAEE